MIARILFWIAIVFMILPVLIILTPGGDCAKIDWKALALPALWLALAMGAHVLRM